MATLVTSANCLYSLATIPMMTTITKITKITTISEIPKIISSFIGNGDSHSSEETVGRVEINGTGELFGHCDVICCVTHTRTTEWCSFPEIPIDVILLYYEWPLCDNYRSSAIIAFLYHLWTLSLSLWVSLFGGWWESECLLIYNISSRPSCYVTSQQVTSCHDML